MKKNKLIFYIFLCLICTGCFRPAPCPYSDFFMGIMFVDNEGKRIQSPYSKVYERTVLTNIDSNSLAKTGNPIHYTLPLPSINNPKQLCFILEKSNGQKDSITITTDVTQEYIDKRCGLVRKYENTKVFLPNTTFSPNKITEKENFIFFNYVFQITL